VPMLFVAGWATAITVIHEKYNTRKLPPDLLVVAMLIFYSCGRFSLADRIGFRGRFVTIL